LNPRIPTNFRILVVEDDDAIRSVIVRTLERELQHLNVSIHEASNTAAASRRLGQPYDAVVSDQNTGTSPTGIELLERFRQANPSAKLILFCGGNLPSGSDLRLRLINAAYVQKPASMSRVVAILTPPIPAPGEDAYAAL
jgi:CheY-like chemotaxis protein